MNIDTEARNREKNIKRVNTKGSILLKISIYITLVIVITLATLSLYKGKDQLLYNVYDNSYAIFELQNFEVKSSNLISKVTIETEIGTFTSPFNEDIYILNEDLKVSRAYITSKLSPDKETSNEMNLDEDVIDLKSFRTYLYIELTKEDYNKLMESELSVFDKLPTFYNIPKENFN